MRKRRHREGEGNIDFAGLGSLSRRERESKVDGGRKRLRRKRQRKLQSRSRGEKRGEKGG